jgi:phosphomannomutase
MASLSNVFKAYDIRGVVPDELNALQFRAIGVAVARFTGAPTILVARDMRDSGVALSEAFALGARSEGAHVIDLGLASTDLLYYAAQSGKVQRAEAVPVRGPSHRTRHRLGGDPGHRRVAVGRLGG